MEIEKAKYVIEIKTLPKAKKLSKDTLAEIKGVVGGKRLARMKKESVDCPILKETVSFIECFICKNFLRRVKGKVDCAGSTI